MNDEFYMRRALDLAKKGWGRTSPNPMVGAVIVKDGRIIGEGWHHRDGQPHAEIECLASCTESPEGSTIYVTLEPCTTHGRTGACSDAIIAAKIKSVKAGAIDPNPLHSGRAKSVFESAGIECEFGILGDECRKLNFIFNHAATKNEALLAIKCAKSADGKISECRGKRTRISSPESSAHLAKLRALFGAIAIGSGTLASDNPSLTIRGFPEGREEWAIPRIILSRRLSIAEIPNLRQLKVFSDKYKNLTRVVCDFDAPKERFAKIEEIGAQIMTISHKGDTDFWSKLKSALLGERISSLMVEGGAIIFESILKAKSADFACIYTSGTNIGPSGLDAFPTPKGFEIDEVYESAKLGSDTFVAGTLKYA